MARHPNVDWNLPDSLKTWEQVNTAVLMDIRDELQRLNRLLYCSNFTAIPSILRAIGRNTTKPRRRRKKS